MRFVQVPACGYGISNKFTYTYSIGAKPTFITEGVTDAKLTIYSTDTNDVSSLAANPFTLTVSNAIEVLNAAQTGATAFTKTLTVSIQLTNPCTAANA